MSKSHIAKKRTTKEQRGPTFELPTSTHWRMARVGAGYGMNVPSQRKQYGFKIDDSRASDHLMLIGDFRMR